MADEGRQGQHLRAGRVTVEARETMTSAESQLEQELIAKLLDLKYIHRADIRDRAALEANFREKFQALNRVTLTDTEFARLLDEIVTADVFTASRTLRTINSFTRDDGTPLNYTLVNIKDWCKNTFEVVSQLRIHTDYSHHRYDVIAPDQRLPRRPDRVQDARHQPPSAHRADRRVQKRPGNV
jgi:type I restriction enzyme, R subunit